MCARCQKMPLESPELESQKVVGIDNQTEVL